MTVEVHLKETSQVISYTKIVNTYTKGPFYYDINESISFTVTEQHSVEDATEEELEAFKGERLQKIRDLVDPIAQDGFDAMWEGRVATGE